MGGVVFVASQGLRKQGRWGHRRCRQGGVCQPRGKLQGDQGIRFVEADQVLFTWQVVT